jgi:hypothetical protein
VWREAAPSWKMDWTSATRRSPSLKKVRMANSSVLVRFRSMPPGRLMADKGRCARRGAERSTFQRLVWTSTMRPTTRSPISGV